MIETIKAKLWDLLREKEVSLAMVFNREGEILWHRGRKIKGRTIGEGEGFSKSAIQRTLMSRNAVEKEDVLVSSVVNGLPESACILKIKCLLIQPVSDNFYLYIDSGIKESFSPTDREIFKFCGELLGEMVERIKKNETGSGGIVGDSGDIERIRDLVLKYSLEEEPVLLLGETGTGKSHIAGLIHKYSGRKGKFVTINTPSIPDNLFESEIFGHRHGAFTGAGADKSGLVEAGEGGTLFFDEIAEVPLAFQAKLLRFIETKKYLVLGDSAEQEADIRIVAATNRDINEAIKNKEFRRDIYFRLQVLEIEIPPLRDRKDDIKALVLENRKLLRGKKMGAGFWQAIDHHHWPGNVRELITVLTRAGIVLDGPISGKDMQRIISQSCFNNTLTPNQDKIEGMWAELLAGRSFWEVVKTPFLQRDINRAEAKAIVCRGLGEAGGKYVGVLELFNIKKEDYHKFMTFLSDNRLK